MAVHLQVLKSTEVLHNVPANDIYGRLYFYVRDLLMTAVKRMKRIPMTFVFSDKSTPLFVHDLRHKSPGILSIYRAMVNYPSIGKDPTQWNLPQFLRSWAPVFTRRGDESLIIRHVADSTGAQWNDTADWEMALDDFDVFISRFSQMDESAHYHERKAAGIKLSAGSAWPAQEDRASNITVQAGIGCCGTDGGGQGHWC